jgi:hypothetical protein
MRFDSEGLFWIDEPVPEKVRKTKVSYKRTPPARTWESPEYLPGIEEAERFDVALFLDDELVQAAISREWLFFDIECYVNYFLICFRGKRERKVVYFEMTENSPLDIPKLSWVVRNFCLIGFNSRAYDMPMLQAALGGASCTELKALSDRIIADEGPGWQLIKHMEVGEEAPNHIDLIEVAPLDASLKLYGGRLHATRMWDLPFAPAIVLSRQQMLIVRWYCVNDLDLTETLFYGLEEQIALRSTLSMEYGKDLRSLSDAQIAETVISGELKKRGVKVGRVAVDIGTVLKYKAPPFIQFQTEYMRRVLAQIEEFEFVVAEDGYSKAPQALEELQIHIGNSVYQMGMGGLHSCEKVAAHVTDGTFTLTDRDVASYYPAIILNCKLFPEHLGEEFLDVYRELVDRRLAAKRAKNKVVADSLKITINGTFGKLGSKWSVLYSPNLLFQVTITGQLGLLMLIEALELASIGVVSANTDGVVSKIPAGLENRAATVVEEWEKMTGFETEAVDYAALYSRDINNYIAVKKDGKTKNKGTYANPWSESFPSIFRMHKNPTTTICIEAVEQYLIKHTPLEDTIRGCGDVCKFVAIRTVRGGAVKDGQYLGKAIRWYYSSDGGGEMIYASTGNRVAKSEGAKPMMTLTDGVPEDVDYQWYVNEAAGMLGDLGVSEFQSVAESD